MDQNHIRKFVMLVDMFQSFMNRILSPFTTFNQNKTFPFCPRLKNLEVFLGNHQENIPDSRMFLECFEAVFQKGSDIFSKKFIFTSLFISVAILIQVQQVCSVPLRLAFPVQQQQRPHQLCIPWRLSKVTNFKLLDVNS